MELYLHSLYKPSWRGDGTLQCYSIVPECSVPPRSYYSRFPYNVSNYLPDYTVACHVHYAERAQVQFSSCERRLLGGSVTACTVAALRLFWRMSIGVHGKTFVTTTNSYEASYECELKSLHFFIFQITRVCFVT